MIGYITGILVERHDEECVILTQGGVGYELRLPTASIASLPAKGEKCSFFVHTIVREDAIILFGFETGEEKEFFRILLSVDKLGPKKALAILSVFSPEKLREIAYREDAKLLSTVPGIGEKSAKQILWFLKEKVEKLGKISSGKTKRKEENSYSNNFIDVLTALKNLGYAEDEIKPYIIEILSADENLETSMAIKAVLQKIAKNR